MVIITWLRGACLFHIEHSFDLSWQLTQGALEMSPYKIQNVTLVTTSK